MKNKLAYINNSFWKDVFLSARFLMALLVFVTVNYALFQPMAGKAAEKGFSFSVLEIVPFYLSSTQSMIIYYLIFLFLVSGFPKWDNVGSQLPRIGKTWWVIQNLIYIVYTALLQYIVLTVCLLFAFFPMHFCADGWSNMVAALCDSTGDLLGFGVNLAVFFSRNVVNIGNPVVVNIISFILYMGCCICIGMLTFLLNICFRRGVGSFVGAFVVMIRSALEVIDSLSGTIINHIYQVIRCGLYPLYEVDLQYLSSPSNPNADIRILLGVIYFMIVDLVLIFYTIHKVHFLDLSKE